MSDISGFSSKMFVAMFVRKAEMIIPVTPKFNFQFYEFYKQQSVFGLICIEFQNLKGQMLVLDF